MEVIEYSAVRGSHLNAKTVAVIGPELYRIGKDNGGWLEPSDVVAEARSVKSVLHPHFEWDERAAAEAYRLEQARKLIRSVTVTVRVDDEAAVTTRAWVHVNDSIDSDADGSGYMFIEEVIDSEPVLREVTQRASDELESWRHRYETYLRIAEFKKAVRKPLRELVKAIA